MKNRIFGYWGLGLSLALLPLAGGCLQQTANPPVYSAAPAETAEAAEPVVAEPVALAVPAPDTTAPVATPPPATDITNAPATALVAEKPLPAGIRSGSPTAGLIKLANSSVDEATMLAFVTNSPSSFSLSADDIIYLNDLGIPSPVITAVLQHDQALKAASATASVPVPVYTAPTSQVAPTYVNPPVAEAVPQPAYVEGSAPAVAAIPAEEAVPSTFYEPLAPYGTWVNVDGYGLCWQPTAGVVNPGWRPYCDSGHWVYSDCGWYWYSDYSWGWAPFHYGRWFRHHRLGWCWYPDSVWGPSWVSWRYGDSYCGWAPLPPAAYYRPGLGLTWYGRSVAVGFDFGLGADCYAFVGWNHFHDHHINHYALPPHQVTQVYNRTLIVNKIEGNNNTIINRGLAPERVAAATHREVRPVAIREVSVNRPVAGRGERLEANNRTLTVYRPRIPEATRSATPTAEHSRPALAPASRPAISSAPQVTETTRATPPTSTRSFSAPKAEPRLGPEQRNTPAASVTPTAPTPDSSRPAVTRAQPGANENPRLTTPTPPARPAAPSSSLTIIGRQNSAASPVRSQSSIKVMPSAPAKASASTTVPSTPPTLSTPAPSAPAVSASRPAPAPLRSATPPPANRVETARSTPGLENHASTPTVTPPPAQPSRPATPSYQAPVRTTASESPRPAYNPTPTPTYRPAPVEAPRSYSPPAAAPTPRYQPSEVQAAPSRPTMAEAPRYSPPPTMAAPPRAPAPESRPAPAPSGSSGSRNPADRSGRN